MSLTSIPKLKLPDSNYDPFYLPQKLKRQEFKERQRMRDDKRILFLIERDTPRGTLTGMTSSVTDVIQGSHSARTSREM